MVCVDAVLISWSVDDAVIIIGVVWGEWDEEKDDCDDNNEESENNDDCGELVSALELGPNVIIEVDSLIEDKSSLVDGMGLVEVVIDSCDNVEADSLDVIDDRPDEVDVISAVEEDLELYVIGDWDKVDEVDELDVITDVEEAVELDVIVEVWGETDVLIDV